ncbi:MAG: ester cyclase [Acidimicrobiales bacterium]|jgi:carboxymethylenebutenolidase
MNDLGALFDRHIATEFVDKDPDATMATMADNPTLYHVPVGTGGRGRDQVAQFYRDHFIPAWPPDVEITPLSRTVDSARVVDEFIVNFTHDRVMDFWLPRIPPTGRKVSLPHVVIVGFEGDKVLYEHIYWDQASLLVQLGLLDPSSLPVTGSDQARGLTDASLPLNWILQ